MSAFTPGPWRWYGYYLMQDCKDENGEPINNPFSTPWGCPIADDGSGGGEYSASIDIEGPNARLIAAAPELYEALQSLIKAIGDDTVVVGTDVLRAIGKAGAALAKVTA